MLASIVLLSAAIPACGRLIYLESENYDVSLQLKKILAASA